MLFNAHFEKQMSTICANEYIKNNCIDCTLKSEPFQQLSEEQMHRVDERRAELFFKKGELLNKQGMFMTHIVFLRKGFAKLYLENDDGITIVGIAKPGSFIGLQALYGESVFPFSAEALTDTEVCMKDISVFRELILENTRFAKGIIEILNTDLIQAYRRMSCLSTKQVNSRFAELLLFLRNVLYQSNPFHLTISNKDIADLISTSPESISRLISNFKDQGIISSKGKTIEIMDIHQLETLGKCKSLSTAKI
jgi:CRP-like cAMP-binding protein